jgi:hypothetical protein
VADERHDAEAKEAAGGLSNVAEVPVVLRDRLITAARGPIPASFSASLLMA